MFTDKLYFKYILWNTQHVYFNYITKKKNTVSLFIFPSSLYYLAIHFKLSTLFYSTQLADLFAYEINLNLNTALLKKNEENKALVYNFHNIQADTRYFVFVVNQNSSNKTLFSLVELFQNANWLEREVGELHGIFYNGKKDLRNLMLQYGDTSAPMIKSYPSIGEREIYFDSVSDLLIQTPVSLQF
jgi:NADH:ubiquinone oxidoreductase subunit C